MKTFHIPGLLVHEDLPYQNMLGNSFLLMALAMGLEVLLWILSIILIRWSPVYSVPVSVSSSVQWPSSPWQCCFTGIIYRLWFWKSFYLLFHIDVQILSLGRGKIWKFPKILLPPLPYRCIVPGPGEGEGYENSPKQRNGLRVYIVFFMVVLFSCSFFHSYFLLQQ